MKIKTKALSYDELAAQPAPAHRKPRRPSLFFRTLVRLAAAPDLRDAQFTFIKERMEGFEDEPCLIVMNHSSFIDLEIVSRVFYPRPYCIVCTSDGFVGKEWLMRRIGCIDSEAYSCRDLRRLPDRRHAPRPEGGALQRAALPGGQLQL